MDVLASLPESFFETRWDERWVPGRDPAAGLRQGANCQRFAYAVLARFGLVVPDHRSAELWADEERLATVPEPGPLDLALFGRSPDPYGAHVAVCLGGVAVLHLCAEVGSPAVWTFDDFAVRHRYRSLIGFKRVRTHDESSPPRQGS